jgi:hypothetical protein
LAVADWTGLRSTKQLWSFTANAETGGRGPQGIGERVLASLAAGNLQPGTGGLPEGWGSAVAVATAASADKHIRVEEELMGENAALVETRRVSLREVHSRRRAQIHQSIATLKQRGKGRMIPLFEAQARLLEERQAQAEARLELLSQGSLRVEALAICLVEVLA